MAADPLTESPTVNGISVTVHAYVSPTRSGDDKEDYWTQFQAWGEITNHSPGVLQNVSGRLVFFDRAGNVLVDDSIATAAQRDVGDEAVGESVYAELEFVEPGQSVPFHAMRNLAAIKGDIAAFAIYPRGGLAADGPTPSGSALGVTDTLGGEPGIEIRLISGTIRNDGKVGCRDPYLVVAMLDAAGRINAVEEISTTMEATGILAAGETIGFSGRLSAYDQQAWRGKAPVRTYVNCKEPL